MPRLIRLKYDGFNDYRLVMATFTPAQQTKHRKSFIEECRQKAWGACCHAAWISSGLDKLLVEYQKLQDEDRTLEADIKAAADAIDYHTVENRDRRKSMQERRNTLAEQMKVIAGNAQRGQKAMEGLLQGAESALQLAEHAETWEWKEEGANSSLKSPEVA